NNFLCISFRSYYSVFKVHPGLIAPSAFGFAEVHPHSVPPLTDGLYSLSLRISARTASQLLFSFEKMVGSSLESRNALSAYTSYKHAFLASRLCSPLVGSSGLEPPTSRLSGARSNHLSYEPIWW